MKPMGFTLSELLLTLLIIAEIATFTIPKVLITQQNQKFNAIAKEAAGSIAQAFQLYQVQNSVSASTSPGDLTPYMNYLTLDTATTVDDVRWSGTVSCSNAAAKCIKLHNGAILWYWNYLSFGGTSTTNAFFYHLDPDGASSSNIAINFYIYTNGKVRSEGEIDANTGVGGAGLKNPNAGINPDWWNSWQ
jgi:type II secretory pathway pseudopilin PulG